MPQAPTIQSNATLLGRTPGLSFADANEFGAGVGEAVRQTGGQLSQTTAAVGAIARTHRDLEADKWMNDAMTQLRDHYSRWSADPENNTKESFADDFAKDASKSMEDWEAKAPTKEARQKFREQFQRFSSSRFEAASITSARNQLDNMLQSHQDNNGSIIRGYEVDRAVPNLDANKELMNNIQDRFASIDSSLGKLAPAKANELKGQLIEDGAYLTMNYSPSAARKILAMGIGLLDGRRIHAIESQIKTAEESMKTVDLAALNKTIENRIDQAKLGRMPAKFELKDIQPYLPDDRANALRDKANAQIDVYNTATEHTNRISSWSASAQMEFLDELSNKAGSDPDTATKDADVLRVVSQRVADNVRHYQRDPAGYMIRNNPAIKGISDHIESLSAQDPKNPMIKQKMAERDALMISLQSPPGEGITGDAKKQYGVVNRSQMKVMSEAEATAAVRRINESSPQEALNTILAELQQHPGNEEIAFNNLVQLREGEGIRGDYWLVYKNWRNPAAADLVGALQASKEARELATDKMSDFEDSLNGYAPWKAWIQTFPSDNHQMEGMLAGMRSGIISYALLQSQTQKLSPELAIRKSVDTWLYSEMAVTTVNGQPVIMDRQTADGPKMSDQEAANIGRNLNLATRFLDPAEIKMDDDMGRQHFPVLNSIGNESTRQEQLREIMLTRGFFKPGADGRTATFYMRNDTGTPFEVRDKQNRAFQINVQDVPELSKTISTFTGRHDITHMTDPLKPTVSVTYEQTPSGFAFRGFNYEPIYQTNWPVAPKWLQRVERK